MPLSFAATALLANLLGLITRKTSSDVLAFVMTLFVSGVIAGRHRQSRYSQQGFILFLPAPISRPARWLDQMDHEGTSLLMKHRLATFGLVAGALVAGGTAGALLGVPGISGAQTSSTSSSSTTDTSNHDAAHEAAESPQHAADEASGKFQGGDGKSNTDPAHEAGESAARVAEEAAHDATVTTTTP